MNLNATNVHSDVNVTKRGKVCKWRHMRYENKMAFLSFNQFVAELMNVNV